MGFSVFLAGLQDTVISHPIVQDWLSKYDLNGTNFWARSNVYQISLDLIIFTFVLYIIFRKPVKEEKPLTQKEIKEMIDEWKPEDLFPKVSERERQLEKKVPTITGVEGPYVIINKKKVLNLVRTDFHGFLTNPEVVKAAQDTTRKYGTGTCGPRQFYGTIDVHLDFEKKLCEFMGTEAALLYSYGFATVSSVIPAFAGRLDLIVADEAVAYAIQTGIKLSRADVIYFKHNDMKDLERILVQITTNKSIKLTRRFIVIEGVYQNVGDIVNLTKVVELKDKYKFRLLMDDSFGIGVIGKTGRGTCEFYNIPPKRVEFITANLASCLSSVGGFCVGDTASIYHQGLHASGYVYSASLPPLLAGAAIQSIKLLEANPKLLSILEKKSIIFWDRLSKIDGIVVSGQRGSPVIHLRLKNPSPNIFDNEEILQDIVDEALDQGVFLTRAKYSSDEVKMPPSSIRIYVSGAFTDEQIEQSLNIIESSINLVLTKNAKKIESSQSNTNDESLRKRKV